MYAHPQQGKETDNVQALRREAGKWLRARREAAGLSQRQLADAAGLEYYTFISQLESGRGRVPPDRYELFARALAVTSKEFALVMMRYYDPITYALIFGEADPAETPVADQSVSDLEQRLRRLEAHMLDAPAAPKG